MRLNSVCYLLYSLYIKVKLNMKKLLLIAFLSVFLLTSCWDEEEIVVSGPKGTAAKKAVEIRDSGSANVGSAWLGWWGGGWAMGWAKKSTENLKSWYKNHNTSTDCYTRINGKVYNVTPLIEKFPDMSDQIISMCGVDSTDYYKERLSLNQDFIKAVEASIVSE
jgi:Cytochrome b5-like Heme/Steroid binding domain